MSDADDVLLDALRERGLEHLTMWALVCLDAALAQLGDHAGRGARAAAVNHRLRSDLWFGSLDACHAEALEDEAVGST